MPAGYEGGLRLVEHYLGRASATKQTRGIFPAVQGAPDINTGRIIRNANDRLTGTAAQHKSTVTAHGVRPQVSIPMDCKPEDMLLPLMAFFHNRKYTQTEVPSGNIEEGTYQFAMLDAKPDHEGVVVGVYDDGAANYKAQVAMADVFSIGVEWLHGHGDLGDTDNGINIDNFVANEIVIATDQGPDNFVNMTLKGFGRDADETADFAEATWGPGINGDISDQAVLTPDKAVISVLDVNAGDVLATYQDWIDGFTITMKNGLDGRAAVGFDEFNAMLTVGRPEVQVSLRMAHVGSDFLTALKNAQDLALTIKMSNNVSTEFVQLEFPLLRIMENFTPAPGGADSDVTVEIPLQGLIDDSVVAPLVEVTVQTPFDIRTNSYNDNASLAQIV